MIDVKEAAQVANRYLNELYSEEPPQGVRLEEVEMSENRDAWLITLSFVDRGNSLGGALAGIASVPRVYKTFEVDANSGEVLAMKIRQLS